MLISHLPAAPEISSHCDESLTAAFEGSSLKSKNVFFNHNVLIFIFKSTVYWKYYWITIGHLLSAFLFSSITLSNSSSSLEISIRPFFLHWKLSVLCFSKVSILCRTKISVTASASDEDGQCQWWHYSFIFKDIWVYITKIALVSESTVFEDSKLTVSWFSQLPWETPLLSLHHCCLKRLCRTAGHECSLWLLPAQSDELEAYEGKNNDVYYVL